MRTYPVTGSRFPIGLHYELAEIDDICTHALRVSNLFPSKPSPVRIERFVEKHFNCVTRYADLGPGYLGCTSFNADGTVNEIFVSDAIERDGRESSRRRVSTTWAHEAGHGLLHGSLFTKNPDQGELFVTESQTGSADDRLILCRGEDIVPEATKLPLASGLPVKSTYRGQWWEYQANRAIPGLLLPRPLVHDALAGFLNRPSTSGGAVFRDESQRENAVRQISAIFDVNGVVARIRLAEMFPPCAENPLF